MSVPPSETRASSTAHPATNAALADPAAITRIRNLELRARVIVEGFMSGLHRSPYHGFSVEFTDYRPYSPGDDLRYLDWKLLARADRTYLKRFEDETNLRCHLVVDFSPSMNYADAGVTKADYARTLAATLARFLVLQRDGVGLVTFADEILGVVPPRFRSGHFKRILQALEVVPGGSETDVARPLVDLANTVPRRGMVVLISDLLVPPEQLDQSLRYLGARGHDVLILRVLTPSEISFPFTGAARFEDMESGRLIYVDPEVARRKYQERFNEHQARLQTICRGLGVDFHTVTTDQPFGEALHAPLHQRARLSGRRTARPAAGGQGGSP